MKKMKWQLMFVALALVAGIAFAGCSKKPAAPATPPAATEQAAPAAPAADKAAPAKAAGDEYNFHALCTKLVDETKAMNGAIFTAALEKKAMDNCMTAEKKYENDPKAQAIMTAYVKTIMDACKDKSGQQWLACYGAEAQNATKAATDAAAAAK
jgi:hypothetical protein